MIARGAYHRGYAVISQYPARMPSKYKPGLQVLVTGTSSNEIFSRAQVMLATDPVQITVPEHSIPLAQSERIPFKKLVLSIDVIALDTMLSTVVSVTTYKNVTLEYQFGNLHLVPAKGYEVITGVSPMIYQEALDLMLKTHTDKMHKALPKLFRKQGGIDVIELCQMGRRVSDKAKEV